VYGDGSRHQLRHAHAVEMSREGVPLVVIQRQLGHREPRYTSHYLSAAPDLLAHAARLLNDAQAVRP
jgi:integrase